MAKWKVPFSELTLEKRIGKGNFGEVWFGKYLGLDVAIKRLFFTDDDFMQKYIEREMDTLTGLTHPNIVQLMGICTERNDVYIITEFVGGGNLRKKLKDKGQRLTWATRKQYAVDIALAMTYLHHKKIMHRDLKSPNLLIGTDGKLKVCDFGLARSSPTEKDQYVTTVGTNEWMAPEVAMQEPYDNSADVFSYAMVLYELITREKPPERKIKDAYAWNAEEMKKTIPADTPPEFWNLLVECASFDPSKRPPFKEIVKKIKLIRVGDDSEEEEDSESEESEKGRGRSRSASDINAGGNRDTNGKESHSDNEEEEEEHTASYIARGKEVNEVTKTIKRAFRKPEFCKVECSIDRRNNWRVGADVPIHVKVNNQTSKEVKSLKVLIETTGAKKGKSKTKPRESLQSVFPLKPMSTLDQDFHFTIPSVPTSADEHHQLVLLWTIKATLGNTTIRNFLPLTIVNK